MLVKHHILFSFIFAYILTYFIPLSLLAGSLVFLSAVLIDIDHYLYYIFVKKDISLKRAYKWFIKRRQQSLKLTKQEKRKQKHVIMIFHGIELLIILFLLTYFSYWFYYVLIGVIFHLFLDIIDMIYSKSQLSLKLSFIYNLLPKNE